MQKDKPKSDIKTARVSPEVLEVAIRGIRELFESAGPTLFKRPEIRAKLALTDTNEFCVVSELAIHGPHRLQMALAADEGILKITNVFGITLSTILMHSGDEEVREKIRETENAVKPRA